MDGIAKFRENVMPSIGLRFVLEGPAFMEALVYEAEALAIIDDWASKRLKLKGMTTLSRTTAIPPGGHAWAVDLESVIAIHTFVPMVRNPESNNVYQGRQQFPEGYSYSS